MERTKPRQEQPEVIYTLRQLQLQLNAKQKMFCQTYIRNGWNQTKAYMKAYPDSAYQSAAACSAALLKNTKIRQYLEYIKGDYELLCGVSKAKQIEEYKKIAYSNIAALFKDWTVLKEYETLTKKQKAAIGEIEYKTEKRIINEELVEVVYVKVKAHNKIHALTRIDKLMDYETPKKVALSGEISVQSVDISKYTEEEKKVLLSIARKYESAK